MGFGKFLAGAAGIVGAVVLAPVALPAAAAVGATALATGAAAAGTVGTVAAGASAVVAAGATAAAGTAVGSAAIAGMTAVGTGVGAAAGAVGLGSIATVAGTSAGAAALGTIATSGAIGVGSAISGASKMAEASNVKESADAKLSDANKKLKDAENSMNQSLEQLGNVKKDIWADLDSYIEISKNVKNIPEHGTFSKDAPVDFDINDIRKIEHISITLNNAITGGIASLSGGSLVGFATSTGFTNIATASTGTAIAGLSGAAHTNAALAALGGGAKAAGGLGMAGGTVVLNALTFAPALAIGGLMVGSKGTKKLESANDYNSEVNRYCKEVDASASKMAELEKLSTKMKFTLMDTQFVFDRFFAHVKKMTNRTTNFVEFTSREQREFFIAAKLGKILTDLVCTQLMDDKTKKIETATVEAEIQKNESLVRQLTSV